MNIKTMRWCDRWLGIPLCAACSLHRRLFEPRGPAAEEKPRRVLFVKLAEQGALVLAATAIRRAIELCGRENVFFAVFEENRAILDALAWLPEANVVAWPSGSSAALARGAPAALARIRRLNIDTVIDLEFFSRATAVLSYLSGAKCRVGFSASAAGAPYRGNLLTERVPFDSSQHVAENFFNLTGFLDGGPSPRPRLRSGYGGQARVPAFAPATAGMPASPRPVVSPTLHGFQPLAGEVDEMRQRLQKMTGVAGSLDLLLIHANCTDPLPLRRWPEQNYVELARGLLHRYPSLRILITGAPAEAAAAESLARRVGDGRCLSLAGQTSLRQLLVLFSLAKVLVTSDSGPAHFATLTPIQTVVLFGPETNRFFGPRGPRSHSLWAGLPCSPCVSVEGGRDSACTDNVCLKQLTVEQVCAAVCAACEKRVKGDG